MAHFLSLIFRNTRRFVVMLLHRTVKNMSVSTESTLSTPTRGQYAIFFLTVLFLANFVDDPFEMSSITTDGLQPVLHTRRCVQNQPDRYLIKCLRRNVWVVCQIFHLVL